MPCLLPSSENDELKNEVAELKKKSAEVAHIKKENESLKQSVAQLQSQLNEQQKLITQTVNQLKVLAVKHAATENVAIKK